MELNSLFLSLPYLLLIEKADSFRFALFPRTVKPIRRFGEGVSKKQELLGVGRHTRLRRSSPIISKSGQFLFRFRGIGIMSLSLPTQKADSFRFAPHSENTIVVKAFWEYVRSSEVIGAYDLRGKCSCSHRWVPSRMACQTNGDGSARRNLQNCIAVPKSHAAGCSLVRPQF